jgi:RNA polymerase sigma factor (TIGR02999 family)
MENDGPCAIVMTTPSTHEVSQLLAAWSEGDEAALEQLIPLIYRELRRQAERYMRGEREGHVLQTTALVHEAYLRLADCREMKWQNRAHFFAVAAQMMRRILVEFARAQKTDKRGGAMHQVSLAEALAVAEARGTDIEALDDALQTLATLNPRQCRVVELRFFGGLSHEEIAEVLKVSVGTVRRDWSLAQAWLYNELR